MTVQLNLHPTSHQNPQVLMQAASQPLNQILSELSLAAGGSSTLNPTYFQLAPYEPKMVAHISFIFRIYLELQLKLFLKQTKVLKKVEFSVELCFRP